MLQTIRDRFTGWIAVAVIGLLGLMLAITFGDVTSDAVAPTVAAEVNGEQIPLLEYQRVVQEQVLRQEQELQIELPPALRQQVERQVLEGMIRNRVVGQYVAERGYRVSDSVVADFIRGLEQFQVGGEFSQPGYVAILSSQGLTPEGFEREQRKSMEIAQLSTGLVGSSFYTPAEFRRYIELEKERRQFSYAVFQPADYLAEVEIAESQIEAVYSARPEEFQTAESVTLEYVELRRDAIAAEVLIDGSELRQFYDANIDQYSAPERRRARHILLARDGDNDEALAERALELRRQLEGGADFAELARTQSDDPGSAAQGGELGWNGRGVYVEAFEDALFGLEVGELSAPVSTEFGYHIIELQEVTGGQVEAFEDIRESLLADLKLQRADDEYYESQQLLDDLALENPGTLAVAAEQLGLAVQRVTEFTRTGGGPFGFSRPLVDAAFSQAVLEDGENSELIELEGGASVVLRVSEHRLPELRPLADVRDQIEEDLALEAAAEQARERGSAFAERARAGAELALLAVEFGVDLNGGTWVERADASVPAEVLADVFRAGAKNSDLPSVGELETTAGGYAIYRLDAIEPGKPEAVARDQRDQRKAVLAEQLGSSSATSLLLNLRGEASVVLAQGVIQSPDEDALSP